MANEVKLTLVPPAGAADARGQESPFAALGDDDLMKLTAAGSRGAFREVVGRYQARVLGVCARSTGAPEEAREIAQEAFVALWQAAPRYRPSGTFAAFLFTIVRNQLRSSARRRASAGVHLRELARTPSPADPQPPLEQMLAAEDQRRLREALDHLPDVHRHAIQLRFSAELSYDEIAGICEVPAGTVRSWVHFGIRKLRALMGDAS
jgi:RNA polymerase sigma-70 factor, ECF subfamily